MEKVATRAVFGGRQGRGAGKQAGRQAGRQADRPAGRQEARKAGRQALRVDPITRWGCNIESLLAARKDKAAQLLPAAAASRAQRQHLGQQLSHRCSLIWALDGSCKHLQAQEGAGAASAVTSAASSCYSTGGCWGYAGLADVQDESSDLRGQRIGRLSIQL
jgi:hypothetical protein